MDFDTIKYLPGVYMPNEVDYSYLIVTDNNIFSFCPDNGQLYVLNARHSWNRYTFKKVDKKLILADVGAV